MKLNKLISILLVLTLMATCLVGCKDEPAPTEPVDVPENTAPGKDLDEALKDAIDWENPDNYDDKENIDVNVNVGDGDNYDEGTHVEVPLPEDWDGMALDPEVEVEKVIWEKEFAKIGINSIRVNAKWDEYIIVGGAKVLASEKTDFSVMPNYFFDDSYQPADVQTAYFVPRVGLLVQKQYPFTNLVTGLLDVEATSGHNNLFIERVAYTVLHNPYEGSIAQISNAAEYSDGEVGIGSSYEDVVSILGKPTNTDEFDSGTGYKNVILTYGTAQTRLVIELSLMNSNDKNEAIVTGIDWLAMAVKDELRTQDGIENFVGYIPPETPKE